VGFHCLHEAEARWGLDCVAQGSHGKMEMLWEPLPTKVLFSTIEVLIKHKKLEGSEWENSAKWKAKIVSIHDKLRDEYFAAFQVQMVQSEMYKGGLEFLLALPRPLKLFEIIYELYNHSDHADELQRQISLVVFGGGMEMMREEMRLMEGKADKNKRKNAAVKARKKAAKAAAKDVVTALGKIITFLLCFFLLIDSLTYCDSKDLQF
jgi:hypothetical protein